MLSCRAISLKHECTMQNKILSENNILIGFAVVCYVVCVALVLLSVLAKDIWATKPELIAQVLEHKMGLLGFIAGTCTFLTVMGKHVTSESTQWTPELPLGVAGGIAGFCAAFLFAIEANLFIRVALLVITTPVFYVLYLWTRRYLDMEDAGVAKIYAQELICAFQIVGWMFAWRCVAGVVRYIFPDIGVIGILLIPTVILLLLKTAWHIRRSSVSLPAFMLSLPRRITRRITKIGSVFEGFRMQAVHTTFALFIAISVIIIGLWVITLINDPTCSASPEVAGGATRILKALAFCWLG